MFQHQGIWLPDGEKHFPEWMTNNGELVGGKGTYQIKKIREALKWVKAWRSAIDVGAHVGLWAMHLTGRFEQLHAFEPMAPFRLCFERNVQAGNVLLYRNPLGAEDRNVGMSYDPADSGGTHVSGAGDMKMRTLDSFDFPHVDFLKIDCEGYELEVLKGARLTLERWHPCVIVEQKPHKLGPNFGIQGTPAVDFLHELGAKTRGVMSGDYIMSWDA